MSAELLLRKVRSGVYSFQAMTLVSTQSTANRPLHINGVAVGRILQMPIVRIFLFLQLMDFLTTIVGFRLGASEASPFIAKMIHLSSPAAGVAASKLIAVGIAVMCMLADRLRLLKLVNIWYGALVLWNLAIITTIFVR